jgi:hypothetical protein
MDLARADSCEFITLRAMHALIPPDSGAKSEWGTASRPGLRARYPLVKVVGADFYGVVVEGGEAGGFDVDDVVLVLERAFD